MVGFREHFRSPHGGRVEKRSNVLISIDEYERLEKRDQQVFLAANTPEDFLKEIGNLAGTEVI